MKRWVIAWSCLLSLSACGGEDDDAIAGGSGGVVGSGGTASGGSGGSAGTTSSGGAGGTAGADAGSAGAGGALTDAASDGGADAAQVTVTLLDQPGGVFTPTAGETLKKIAFGQKGTSYGWVRVQLDVKVGDWQPELPDEGAVDRTEHILFGLFRANQTQSDQRYLMGSAAVTFANKGPHFRMFGRKTLGPGYTTYTSWSVSYAWQKDAVYHLDCLLDGLADVQRCELFLGGALVKKLEGTVPYLDPAAHLSSGFYVELGTGKPGDIEASPLGWVFSNLVVTAALLP